MTELTRRAALRTVSAGALGLAGCIAPDGPDDSETDSDGTDSDDGTDPADESDVALDGATVTTTRTDCGSPEDERVTVAVTDGTVTVAGVTPAPNPCQEAVLEGASVTDGHLSLTVGVQETRQQGDCIQCTGRIDYEVRVDHDAVERVTVDHVEGEQHTVESTAFADEIASPSVRSSTIETTDTSCSSGDEDRVDAERKDSTLVVTGTLPANDPCHEAALEEVGITNDRLSIRVGVQSDGTEACIKCIGAVTYTARVELDGIEALDSVRVDHEGAGTHGMEWESESTR